MGRETPASPTARVSPPPSTWRIRSVYTQTSSTSTPVHGTMANFRSSDPLVDRGAGHAHVGIQRVLVRAAAPASQAKFIADLRHGARSVRRGMRWIRGLPRRGQRLERTLAGAHLFERGGDR